MSVTKNNRNTSPIEFLDAARRLEKYTIQTCIKFPKRYMFFVTQHLVELSTEIYDNAKKGNSMYAETKSEYEERLLYFSRAYCAAQALGSQLDIAKLTITFFETARDPTKQKTKPIKPRVWEFWGEQINRTFNLLKATHKALFAIYKDRYGTEEIC